MAYDILPAQTGEDLQALDADALRFLWQKKVKVHAQEEDFFKEFEGMRPDSLIETVRDTSKGGGQSIRFTSMGGFYRDGKHGEDEFENSTDFEKIKLDTDTLYVDWIRNGWRHSQRMEDFMGLRYELSNKVPEELGKWLGRKKNWTMWMSYRELGTGSNHMIAGGRASVDDLVTGDGLSWNDIVDAGTVLKTRGAPPAYLGKIKNNPIFRYCVMSSATGLRNLKQDADYLEALQQAGNDSFDANHMFTGGYADVDGHMIREFRDLDHGGNGPIGSPITPRIRIKDAITSGTSGFTITGGDGDTGVKFTQAFPNHDFKFNASHILSKSGSPVDFYVAIVNPPTAATDPGKIGFYKCSTNDGNKITVTQRLASSASGIAATTVGSVTWNTGVWSGKHTVTHPAGATAYLCNAKGQPYGWTVIAGAQSARRAYGKYDGHRATDSKEGKFFQEVYIWSVFGQKPVMREDGEYPNYITIKHAINYPGVPFPTIT